MDRLRDFASRNRRPFQFSIPISLSRRNLAEDSSIPQTREEASDSQSLVNPTSCSNASTQTNMDNDANTNTPLPATTPELIEPTNMVDEKESSKYSKKPGIRQGHENYEQELLKLAEAVVAQGDALSDSGRDLSKRVNDMARDVLEANQAVERKGTEIAGLNEQLRVMQLKFDKAHAQLQQAQRLAGDVIDGATFYRHATDKRIKIEGEVRAMKEWVRHQDVKKWSSDKVDRFLNGLQSLHDTNEMDFGHSKSISEDIVSIAQVFKGVDCDPKFATLLSLANTPTDNPEIRHQACQEASYRWAEVANLDRKPLEKVELDGQMKKEDNALKTNNINPSQAPAAPPPPQASSSSSQTKKGESRELSITDCGCFACHVGKLAAHAYGDEAPEALRNAFLRSINGMESGLEGFIAATRTMPREFKQAATEALKVICEGNKALGLLASSDAIDEATIREAAVRLGGTLVPVAAPGLDGSGLAILTPGSGKLCGCCKGEDVVKTATGET